MRGPLARWLSPHHHNPAPGAARTASAGTAPESPAEGAAALRVDVCTSDPVWCDVPPGHVRVDLPRLIGAREHARALCAHLPADLTGCTALVYARHTRWGAPSFADELAHELLAVRGAAQIRLCGAPPDFAVYLAAAAATHASTDRPAQAPLVVGGTGHAHRGPCPPQGQPRRPR